ncbi:hypothetical protein NGK65_05645 [Serratia ureilytica]|uniref:hypothetical protein n=2 Tax=Serratia TaxID=613 RepID=UPI002DB79DA9|nr:hypothetical protein [Serratia ureilytica]MEB7893216.1 hypothetical protein [Serratia ureilytica]
MMDKTPEEIAKEYFEQQFADEDKRKKSIQDKLFIKLDAHVKKVTPELFARFLDERGASRTCLSCGSNKLSVPETTTIQRDKLPENFSELSPEAQSKATEGALVQYVSYSFIEDETMPRLSNVKYRVNCLNCGFISFYRASPVVQWVMDQEEAGKDE